MKNKRSCAYVLVSIDSASFYDFSIGCWTELFIFGFLFNRTSIHGISTYHK